MRQLASEVQAAGAEAGAGAGADADADAGAEADAGAGADEVGAGVLQAASANTKSVDLVMAWRREATIAAMTESALFEGPRSAHCARCSHFESSSHLKSGAQSALPSHALSACWPHAMS